MLSQFLRKTPTLSVRHFHCQSTLFAEVSAEVVKQLRRLTDAPLGQCRKALEESQGDIEKAKEWLKKKGIQTAQKKSTREALQGVVGAAISQNQKTAVIYEFNCETDFVQRNEKYQKVATEIGTAALSSKYGNVQELLQNAKTTEGKSVSDAITDLVAAIGENIQLRRFQYLETNSTLPNAALQYYVHNTVGETDAIGQVGAIVSVSSSSKSNEDLKDFGRTLAKHIVAMQPSYFTRKEVPADVLAKEREIQTEKAKNEGKNEQHIPKIVDGKMEKWYAENVLMEQSWIMDDKKSVQQLLKTLDIQLDGFVRFRVGDIVATSSEKKE